jgi:hypothetical protein
MDLGGSSILALGGLPFIPSKLKCNLLSRHLLSQLSF